MIRIKYGLNPQGIKEVEIQPLLMDSLVKKGKENKKRPEQKKNNPKKKGRKSKGFSHTTQKGVETKRRNSEVHLHTAQIKQNGVETKEGTNIHAYSSGHGCPIVKEKVKGEESCSMDFKQ